MSVYSLDKALFRAVPEGFSEESVILDSNRVDNSINLKRSFLKHHYTCVVDTSSFGENQYWECVTCKFQLSEDISLSVQSCMDMPWICSK